MSDEQAYLQELTKKLDESIAKLEELDPNKPVDDDTYEILKEAYEAEELMRKNHDIGVRFNILKSQLETLYHKIEHEVGLAATETAAEKKDVNALPADEALVYVSLFNTQGNVLNTWQKLVSQKALFEHSVNRPIYASQEEVENMIAHKPNKDQSAYLIIAVKINDIMSNAQTTTLKDPLGFPLLRLKQGALKIEKIRGFVHKGVKHVVTKDGIQ